VRTSRSRNGAWIRRSGLVALLAAALLAVGAGAAAGSRAHTGTTSLANAKARALLARADIGRRLTTGSGPATAKADACGTAAGLVCTTVTVPLDRTGQVPGTIPLHVEELPAQGTPRGVMFLIAGGPGQGSAHVFTLGDPAADALYRYLFPGYTLVAYDDRGTGESGLLDCPSLQTAITADAERDAATACGAKLGASASFYSTADHAEDLDAVRQALGFDKVGLYGVSYGTKLAMAYAYAHPDHVDRLLLDSVVPPLLPDSYGSNVLQKLPGTLQAFCAAGCNGPSFASDVVAVANKLGIKPLQGKVVAPGGRTTTKKVDGLEVLSVVLDADLNPGLAAELPAVMHAARLGNTQPLLRLAVLHDLGNEESSIDLSFALYAATVCRDGPFPWAPDTPPAQRAAILQSAIADLPAGTLGPFGTWAARFGNADFCTGWPGPTGGVTFGPGPLPNVPMLAVSGGFDMRTPTAGATSIVSQFPQGHLLVVPGVGHSTVTADPSGCAVNGVRTWILGGAVPSICPRQKPLVVPVKGLPAPGLAHPRRPAAAKVTYTTANETIQDAEALWLMTSGVSGTSITIPGIFGGKLVAAGRSFTLANYSDARGVTLTGTLTLTKLGPPLAFQGAVTVGGAAAAHGVLGLSGASLRGTLGGRPVG
jgi:pimeloyl-ACP methyl ester carboxylesterase